MLEDLKPIGLGNLTSLVTSVQVSLWGNEILLECVYDPTYDRLPYKLAFLDCRDIQWTVHSPEDIHDLEADLIDIQLGQDAHRKAAIVFTDIFEIVILYGSFRVDKEW